MNGSLEKAKRSKRTRRPAATSSPAAVDDCIRRVAIAFAAFEEWMSLAGQRSRQAFRVFPTLELRRRFITLEAGILNAVDAIPPAGRKTLMSVRDGIASEIRETADREVAFGAFFVDEIARLAELLKLYAREAGFTDKELAAKDRRGGAEKLT